MHGVPGGKKYVKYHTFVRVNVVESYVNWSKYNKLVYFIGKKQKKCR